MSSSGLVDFKQKYVLNPIFLTDGIAGGNMPGGSVPLLNYLQGQGALEPSQLTDDISFFAQFDPAPGAVLNQWEYAKYPFANQQIAANAAIKQPTRFSIRMICPWKQAGDAFNKPAVMAALQSTLDQHINKGGTFTVVFPTVTYLNALLNLLHDVTQADLQQQRQTTFEFMFEVPLITLSAAQAAQSSLMQKISNGTPVTGDPPSYSGQGAAVGNQTSGQAPAVVPTAAGSVGGAAGQAAASPTTTNPAGG